MKLIILLIMVASLFGNCNEYAEKIKYYQMIQSKSYTGDFIDVIKQYKIAYDKCLKEPKKQKSIYRNQNQNTISDGYLFKD